MRIVVVEDGGSLVLWKVRGCRRLVEPARHGGRVRELRIVAW